MQNNVLEIKNLTKKFGELTAVDDISFELKEGEILGLLGPNGAGKTTTIHMLLGVTTLDSGKIEYFGKDFYKHKQFCLQQINFSSAFNELQGSISSWENLLVFAYLYGIKNPKKKIMELANYFGIASLLAKRFWDLSQGQRTRVIITKSLLNDPKILLMDEPTASLDPDVADKTLSLIEDLRKSRNISILYTSHNMQEVTRICDRVIFLDRGKIVAENTPLGLTKQIEGATLQIMFDGNRNDVEEYLKKQNQIYNFEDSNLVIIKTEEKLIPKIIFGLGKTKVWIADIEIKKPTLEDVFLQIARGGNDVNN